MSGDNNSVLVRHEMFHFCLFYIFVNIMQLIQASQIFSIYRGSRIGLTNSSSIRGRKVLTSSMQT